MNKQKSFHFAMLLGFLCITLLWGSMGRADAATNVLLIWDVNDSRTQELKTALENAGITVTLSATSETGYDGTNPGTAGFNAIIHLNGTTYMTGMPAAGQNALVSFVQNGGGFIHSEWSAYEILSGTMLGMREIILFDRVDGPQNWGTMTCTAVPGQEGHPVLQSVSSPFSVANLDWNPGPAHTFATDPVTVLMTDQDGNAAVAVRNYGTGKVVGFHHSGNYSSGNALSHATIQQLYINAVLWSTGALPPGACGSITMTHSVSQAIVAGNSVACNSAGVHTDNSYWRKFKLSDFGVLGDMTVCSVEIGIEQAAAPSGSQPITIRLYTSDQPFPAGYPGSLTLVGSVDTTVANAASLTVADIPITAAVPAGSELVVEVFTPNGQAAGNSFFIGSNSSGQSGPSYISAGDCGVTTPTDLAALGFPNMHIVNSVKAASSVTANTAPAVSGVGVSADVLSWTYTDADSDPQASYEAAVCATSPCTTASADVLWSEAASNANTSTTIATTLIKGTTYYAAVRANDGTDWSSWAEASFAWSINNAPTSDPVAVSGTTVSWTYNDIDSDLQSGFELEVRTGAGGAGALAWSTSGAGAQTSAAVTGSLLFNQTYYVRVRVNDGTAWGAWAETSFANAATAGIITPNGGEEIPTGSTYRISWNLTPFFDGITPQAVSGASYKLFLSTDSGATWTKLAGGITSTSYDWYVPAQWGNLKKSLVRVVAVDASGSKVAADVSDANFTIEVVKLTSPDGGSVTGGGTVAITWDTFLTMRPAAQTAVQLNCGTGWSTIATLSGNPGSYSWKVPSDLKGASCTAKVILRDRTHGVLGADASNKAFEVK